MRGLTEKQKEVLDYVSEFIREEGMPPTITEISQHFKVQAATAFAHIRALQRKGFVNRSSKARSLTLPQLEKPRHYSLTLSIPVLGRISAGVPLLVEQNIEGRIQVDAKTLPRGIGDCKLFALQVHGESMRDLGILDGDTIIAKQTPEAQIGDVVVASVDGETTVKSLYLTDDKQCELRPANPEFHSRFVSPDHLEIQGVVVMLQRTFGQR